MIRGAQGPDLESAPKRGLSLNALSERIDQCFDPPRCIRIAKRETSDFICNDSKAAPLLSRWKAMLSIIPVMSAILRELSLIALVIRARQRVNTAAAILTDLTFAIGRHRAQQKRSIKMPDAMCRHGRTNWIGGGIQSWLSALLFMRPVDVTRRDACGNQPIVAGSILPILPESHLHAVFERDPAVFHIRIGRVVRLGDLQRAA